MRIEHVMCQIRLEQRPADYANSPGLKKKKNLKLSF